MSFLVASCLCVGIEAFFGACRVDVMQLLLLLRLDVFILLNPAGVLQVAPVGSERHQEVDLWEGSRAEPRRGESKHVRTVTTLQSTEKVRSQEMLLFLWVA